MCVCVWCGGGGCVCVCVWCILCCGGVCVWCVCVVVVCVWCVWCGGGGGVCVWCGGVCVCVCVCGGGISSGDGMQVTQVVGVWRVPFFLLSLGVNFTQKL